MRSAGIVGTGAYLPDEVRKNDFFNQFELLSYDSIFDQSGILERRIAKVEKSSDMETKALLNAVENAGITIQDVELILLGSIINDQIAPNNAALVQHKSGARNAAAIFVETACVSLIAQMIFADALIKCGTYNTVACVVGCNWTISADYTEKNCMLMGDGAAALILQPVAEDKGILSSYFETDGEFHSAIGRDFRLPRGLLEKYISTDPFNGCRERVYTYFQRDDGLKKIKKDGGVKIPEAARNALAKAGYTETHIDALVTHQPTKVLTDMWRNDLCVPNEKHHITIEKYGNMSAASMGVTLHEAVLSEKIKDGDIVVMCGPGAGFHYAAIVLKWGK